MSATHFLAILKVELRKLFRHPAGRLGIILAICIGIAGPAAILWFGSSSAEINGRPLAESLTYDAPTGILWALRARNVTHLMRLVLLALGALAVAGELKARTLREAMLRPVPRWVFPIAKWLALSVWLAVANLFTWLAAAVVGAVLLSPQGDWSGAAKAMAVTTYGDLGVAALIVALALLTRSVAGSIVVAVMLTIANWFSRAFLYVVEEIARQAGQDVVYDACGLVRPWLPTYALDGWTSQLVPFMSLGDDWWQPLVMLVLLIGACLGAAVVRLQRLDIQ